MERHEVVRFDVNILFCIMRSMASKRFLDLIDFASVIACIWMVFWLIYFNFVKDFIEILIYATFKYVNRLMWLYRLLKLDVLVKRTYDFLENYELNYSMEFDNFQPKVEIPEIFTEKDVSVNNSTFSRSVLECNTPSSSKNKVDINPRCIDFTEELSCEMNSTSPENSTVLVTEKRILLCPEKNSVSCTKEDGFSSTGGNNITCNTDEYFDSNKTVISSLEANVMTRSGVNPEPDAVFLSPDQELGLKENFFSWNINRIRDSFRKQNRTKLLTALSVKCKSKAEEIIQVQPTGLEDKENLIITNDSPVDVGCCNNLFITFRSKFQMKETIPGSVHYKRF